MTTMMNMKLEVLIIPVSDVDRAKAFYESLGWRLDLDLTVGDFRGIQITPHNSNCSIIFGKGVTSAEPGSTKNLILAVENVDTARQYLVDRGVNVSEVFYFAAGPFNNTIENPRVIGRDPQNRSYFNFASFEDPDGNGWFLQEVTTRFPGREWKSEPKDNSSLAKLLRETGENHDAYEKSHGEHHWSDWYAAYINSRQSGSTPEKSSEDATRYMDEVFRIPRK